MAISKNGWWAPIAALLKRQGRGASAVDPATVDELRGILEAVPAAVVAQGQDGRVLAWNRAAARIFGWTAAQGAGEPPRLVPPDARAAEASLRHRVLAGNEIFRAPGFFLHASGETLNLLMSAAPRRNAAGKIVGIVSILEESPGAGRSAIAPPPPAPPPAPLPPWAMLTHEAAMPGGLDRGALLFPPMDIAGPDISGPGIPSTDVSVTGKSGAPIARPLPTARKREPAAALEQPSRLLGKVSHDLRQPLHALSLLTGALERRVQDPGARELIGDAGTMIRALQTTFDNLVDLARLDEGSVQAQPVVVSARDLLAPLATEFTHAAARCNIALRHVDSAATIRTDPLLAQRLLRQLLANALRFATRDDGARGKVLLGARRHGDLLRLMVVDDGIGIAADQQATMFDPFVQSEAGRASGGLGLGLAIAARLARLLNTEVGLQSQSGKGSRFWIDVPLAADR